jgi:hypothetical protein
LVTKNPFLVFQSIETNSAVKKIVSEIGWRYKITCDMTQTFRVRSMSMGIKRILLKLVDDIPRHLTNPPPKRTGSISGFLHTRQLGLHLGQRNWNINGFW